MKRLSFSGLALSIMFVAGAMLVACGGPPQTASTTPVAEPSPPEPEPVAKAEVDPEDPCGYRQASGEAVGLSRTAHVKGTRINLQLAKEHVRFPHWAAYIVGDASMIIKLDTQTAEKPRERLGKILGGVKSQLREFHDFPRDEEGGVQVVDACGVGESAQGETHLFMRAWAYDNAIATVTITGADGMPMDVARAIIKEATLSPDGDIDPFQIMQIHLEDMDGFESEPPRADMIALRGTTAATKKGGSKESNEPAEAAPVAMIRIGFAPYLPPLGREISRDMLLSMLSEAAEGMELTKESADRVVDGMRTIEVEGQGVRGSQPVEVYGIAMDAGMGAFYASGVAPKERGKKGLKRLEAVLGSLKRTLRGAPQTADAASDK